MRVYGVFDGGGVKGAALAGCLKAAKDQGLEFEGYGGTSAGSIIALLAAVGYTGDEIRDVMVELNFSSLLDDGGTKLNTVRGHISQLTDSIRNGGIFSKVSAAYKIYQSLSLFTDKLGLYEGDKIREFVVAKIGHKIPPLSKNKDVSFHDLAREQCAPLKIVASDVSSRMPVVFSNTDTTYGGSVVEAVRASTSYPFVFRPVKRPGGLVVDGGLASNLPSFLFASESRETRIPTLAFDLVSANPRQGDEYDARQYLADILATGLEASDVVIRSVVAGVHHISVPIPNDVNTLDFSISKDRRQSLFDAGYRATGDFLRSFDPLRIVRLAGNEMQKKIQAIYGSPAVLNPVLLSIAARVEESSWAEDVRVSVMLPTGRGTRMVIYSYKMLSDSDLEIPDAAGCSGRAWTTRKPYVADLQEADPKEWGISPEIMARVPAGRKAMLSFPIFSAHASEDPTAAVVGVLSVDTSTDLKNTGWIADGALSDGVAWTMTTWAGIVARLLA